MQIFKFWNNDNRLILIDVNFFMVWTTVSRKQLTFSDASMSHHLEESIVIWYLNAPFNSWSQKMTSNVPSHVSSTNYLTAFPRRQDLESMAAVYYMAHRRSPLVEARSFWLNLETYFNILLELPSTIQWGITSLSCLTCSPSHVNWWNWELQIWL